jgi:hypothetical protein
MSGQLFGIEHLRKLAAEAEPLAPWMHARIENIRGTVKRDNLTGEERRNAFTLLYREIDGARRRRERGSKPIHTDIMDASGLRPRPYEGERKQ